MKRCHWAVRCSLALVTLAGGCAPPVAPPPPTTPPPPGARGKALADRPGETIAASAAPAGSTDGDVVARVGTKAVTKDQLLAPMVEAHGLSFLLHIVQLELARQAAQQHGITVTDEDIKQERTITFQRMFKESDDALRVKLKEAIDAGDNDAAEKIKAQLNVNPESLLDQYLAQQFVQTNQYVSRQEFDLVLATNAHLRKIAEASAELKEALTDDMLRKAFAAQYGEKIVVRHIQANDTTTLSEARRQLKSGRNFGDVAKDLSTNKNTGPIGGAIPPFTMNAPNVPEVFKQTAFALKNGEVSDVVHAEGAYHLIKVENRIAPKVVKFENVKDSIRADLYDKILQAAVKQLRDKLAAQLVANLQIDNPVLKEQFQKRLQEGKARQAQAELDDAMKRSRAVATPADDAAPVGPAAPAPSTAPADTKKTGGQTKGKPATRPAASAKKPAGAN